MIRKILFTFTILPVCLRAAGAEAPYPPSPGIAEIVWAPTDEIVRLAGGSDNWPLAWGDDGPLYTAYGDGWGFEPKVPEKLSLGFAKVLGYPPDIEGVNIRANTLEQHGDGPQGKKAGGLLMVDGVLYLWARNADNSQLAWSMDRGETWRWCDWRFTDGFGCPTFLDFGQNYQSARDEYVYVYSHNSDSAYVPADSFNLARVPSDRILDREAYEFFVRPDEDGRPVWAADIAARGAVFENPGRCYRSGVSYNSGLGLYMWSQTLPEGEPRFEGGFGVYTAPEPWGPWTTAFYAEKWDVGPGETSSFPPKWMSPDGLKAYLVFSGDDYFSVREARLVLK